MDKETENQMVKPPAGDFRMESGLRFVKQITLAHGLFPALHSDSPESLKILLKILFKKLWLASSPAFAVFFMLACTSHAGCFHTIHTPAQAPWIFLHPTSLGNASSIVSYHCQANCHKLSGFKQSERIVVECYGSEVQHG